MASRRKRSNVSPDKLASLGYYTASEARAIIQKFAPLTLKEKSAFLSKVSRRDLIELLLLTVDTSSYLLYFLLYETDIDDLLSNELNEFKEDLREIFFELLFQNQSMRERWSASSGYDLPLSSIPENLAEEVRNELGWVFPADSVKDINKVLKVESTKPTKGISATIVKMRDYDLFPLAELDVALATDVKNRLGWEYGATKAQK